MSESARRFLWTKQPAGEVFVRSLLSEALARNFAAERFRERLLEICGVRLRDIVDHIAMPDPHVAEAAGWAVCEDGVWRNSAGFFPEIVSGAELTIAFRVECLDRLRDATGAKTLIEGPAHGPFRRLRVFESEGVSFIGVERRGWNGFDLPDVDTRTVRAARVYLQAFRARRRQFSAVSQGLAYTEELTTAASAELGAHWACALFLRAEREHWARRCDAGALQTRLQNEAGIGWSNVDHHTYDSSREHFLRTIAIFETLGYICRELFYAGDQAGWGSQILEQPVERSTIFADIDLAPDEVDIDIGHIELPPLARHRRAGLWCAMHGESILEAGINHVAGMYDQKLLRSNMARRGCEMMPPFSNFDHLYQELTAGERWPVDPSRVDKLEVGGHLSQQEAEDFRLNGALATHLENLERNDGYKGFNQPGIDDVLRIIDPRQNLVAPITADG